MVGGKLAKPNQAQNLCQEKEDGRDGAFQKISNRLPFVHLGRHGWVGERPRQSILVHGEARKHELEPQLGLGKKDARQGRQRANLARQVVAVQLKVHQTFHSFRVVAEAVVPVCLVGGALLAELRTARKLLVPRHHQRVEAALHLTARGDGAKRRAGKPHRRQRSVGEGRVDALLVQQPRVGQLLSQLLVGQACGGARAGNLLVERGGVQKDGKCVAIPGARNDHVALKLAAVLKQGAFRGESEPVAVELATLRHHGGDEALIFAPKLGERARVLLQVELPNRLQHFGLLRVRV
mmetsp:Transcript_56568/g.97421  ORF Transcript_56568/g.97421 Transcript_56568/m.97421 type:complete len:294 (-) Transcript_56568:59-940(-)